MKDCPNRDGQRFGNYRLGECLGGGGFACVFKGEHVFLGTHAAIKMLRDRVTDEEKEAFLVEARTIARLEHPHIVPILEFGVESDIPFLVMTYKSRGSLRTAHSRGSLLPLPAIVSYVKQVAEALQYAHDQKVVHRDIKPDNLLLGNHGEILLSDFGIAVKAHRTHSWVQQKVAGTAIYMAPEQFRAHAVPASDQYSLAVIIYEWLSGKVPFTADAPSPQEQFLQLAHQHNEVPPPPLHEKGPTISDTVEEVVLKALAKDPQQRFASVLAFASALEQASQPKPPIGTPLFIYRGHCDEMSYAMWSPNGENIASVGHDKTVQVWNATTGATISTYRGHPMRFHVASVTWSNNGTHLLARKNSSSEGEVHIWDASTGGDIHIYPLYSLVSPDGKYVAFIGDLGSLQIWNGSTGKTIVTHHEMKAATWSDPNVGHMKAAAWSPDSKRFAFLDNHEQIQIWDATSRTIIVTYTDHVERSGWEIERSVWGGIDWSPDGKHIATGSTGKRWSSWNTKVWDTKTGATIFTWPDLLRSVWSPDSKYIALTNNKTVLVGNVDTRESIVIYHGHSASVHYLSWSPDSIHIASSGDDQTVQVWNATTDGASIFTWSDYITWGDGGWDREVWSPNGGCIAFSSNKAEVQVRDASTGTPIVTYYGHSAPVIALVWSPDGKYITSTDNKKTIQVWEVTTGATIFTWSGRPEIAWSPDGSHIAAGTEESGIYIWSPATKRANITYRGHLATVSAVAWSSNRKHIASASGKVVQIWDAATGTTVASYRGHLAHVNALTWSPNGKHVASAGDDETVQIWNATTAEHAYTYRGYLATVNAVVWSPDGSRIASAYDDGTMQIWNAVSGENVFTYQEVSVNVNALAWSPDGTYIAAGNSPRNIEKLAQYLGVPDTVGIKVWDAVTGRNVFTYSHFGIDFINAVAWSPDGSYIASASGDEVIVWNVDVKNTSPSLIYRGHAAEDRISVQTPYVTTVAWSLDGKYIASAGHDGTVQIWSAATGETLYTYRDHGDVVNAIAWSPDSTRIASASFGVHVWWAK